ncbi:MAG TPA: methenyltetrahydrofolate cyclohydrolase [Synergistaceae bacterium]|nr:methenyltetrahydrofolate cyclohydrolase [Synergistaceae bacterium]
MKDIASLPVEDLLEELSSSSATPGGGSASALCASIAARLTAMVANLTVGRSRFAEVQEEMVQTLERSRALSKEFLDLAMKDCDAFDRFMEALALPRDSEQDRETRKRSMQEALKGSTLVPMRMVELAGELAEYCLAVASRGNPNAITDAGVSALLIGAASRGASMNARINLASIEDGPFVEESLRRLDAALERTGTAVDKVLAEVSTKLPR